MKKSITIVAAFVLFYFIPLLAKPELIINYKIVILMIGCAVLFYTQPALSIQEAEEMKRTDKNSIFAILIATGLAQIAAVIDWGCFQTQAPNDVITAIGLIMLIGGSAFRIWAIRILGRFFTATVQIQEGQRIIQRGPYRIVRHPSYLGAYIAIIGSTIFLGSIIGFAVAVIGMGIAYKLRIDTEEETLAGAFGQEYREYQSRTARIIPCIW